MLRMGGEEGIVEKKDIVNFLKNEADIEWLELLHKFIGHHIEFLKSMKELEKKCDVYREKEY